MYSVLLCAARTPPPPTQWLVSSLTRGRVDKSLTQFCLNVGTAFAAAANIETSLDQLFLSAGIVGSWTGSQTAELGQTVEVLTSFSKAN